MTQLQIAAKIKTFVEKTASQVTGSAVYIDGVVEGCRIMANELLKDVDETKQDCYKCRLERYNDNDKKWMHIQTFGIPVSVYNNANFRIKKDQETDFYYKHIVFNETGDVLREFKSVNPLLFEKSF